MQVGPRVGPMQTLADGTEALHAGATVVEVAVLLGDLLVQRQQQLLTLLDRCRDVLAARLLRIQIAELLVDPMHHFDDLLVLLEDDLGGTRRLQDAAASVDVREHFDRLLVDLRVQHDPSTTSQLSVWRDVDGHRMLVIHQSVDDHGTVLEHLCEHVAGATREATPVCEDDQGQALAAVEVPDRLRCLVGGVWVPHLAGLQLDNIPRSRLLRICWDVLLHAPGLDCDDADWQTAAPAAADDHGLAPAAHVLVEAALVAPSSLPRAVDLHAAEHVPGVVCRLSGPELDLAAHRVGGPDHWRQRHHGGRHEGEPAHDGLDTILVVLHKLVRDTVWHHDVRTAELILRGVDLFPHEFVQGLRACEDHRTLDHLDVPLAKPVEVRADAHTAARGVGQGEGLLICPASLARDQAAALQALDTDAALRGGQILADDGIQHMPRLAIHCDRVRLHRLRRELLVLVIGDVKVLEALHRVVLVDPGHLNNGLQLLNTADPCAGIAGDVDPGDALGPGKLGGLVKELVLDGAEGTTLNCDVVADEDDLAAIGVLGRVQRE
mmetsp:Transcript_156783/g.500284  ORF Transcript_156783/g.500284 Transcript_156783/m.500284 type:complete len:550 (+) Transcript_156783:401-2050(+)